MQGWRNTMEDSHIACTNLDDNVSIFGVFDGHGGNAYQLLF
jgi:protein phosphatase 1G